MGVRPIRRLKGRRAVRALAFAGRVFGSRSLGLCAHWMRSAPRSSCGTSAGSSERSGSLQGPSGLTAASPDHQSAWHSAFPAPGHLPAWGPSSCGPPCRVSPSLKCCHPRPLAPATCLQQHTRHTRAPHLLTLCHRLTSVLYAHVPPERVFQEGRHSARPVPRPAPASWCRSQRKPDYYGLRQFTGFMIAHS